MSNPADPLYQLTRLYQRVEEIAALVRTVADVAKSVSVERAKVTAVSAPQATIEYTPGGTTRKVPYLGSAPSVNDQVLIINSPVWSGVLGKVSA